MKQAKEAENATIAAAIQSEEAAAEGGEGEGEATAAEAEGEGEEKPAQKEIYIKPLLTILVPSLVCNKDWTYEHHGKDWKCGCKGKNQSPCNIPTNGEGEQTFVKLQLNYEETSK